VEIKQTQAIRDMLEPLGAMLCLNLARVAKETESSRVRRLCARVRCLWKVGKAHRLCLGHGDEYGNDPLSSVCEEFDRAPLHPTYVLQPACEMWGSWQTEVIGWQISKVFSGVHAVILL